MTGLIGDDHVGKGKESERGLIEGGDGEEDEGVNIRIEDNNQVDGEENKEDDNNKNTLILESKAGL